MNNHKQQKIYGLTKALQIVNLRELRGMFAKHNQSGWYRLMADAKEIKLPKIQSSLSIIREKIR